jgi:tRNA (guanine-N7-)-methyltransferase
MTALPDNASSHLLADISLSSNLDLSGIFGSTNPIEVDLGCGKGRFLSAHAAANPDRNFLGVDKKISRLRKVDKKICRSGLKNVHLLHVEAAYTVEYLLPPQSVAVFYIFFPDPWPKRKHHRRRLFSPEFMTALHASLASNGCFHVATDHKDYFDTIRSIMTADRRFEEIEPFVPPEEERTDFEIIFRDRNISINRASFKKL